MKEITRIAEDGSAYMVPSRLVHWLITSIIGGIVAIAGYMVVWAVADSAWKAALIQRIASMEKDVGEIRTQTNLGVLPITAERLRAHEKRLEELEELGRKH